MSFKKRIRDAVYDGEVAFWEVIGEKFPEVKVEEFPSTVELEDILTEAVESWLSYNHPELKDLDEREFAIKVLT